MVLGMEELEVVKGNKILIYLYANISTIQHQVTGAMWQLELSECLLCGQEGQEKAHKCTSIKTATSSSPLPSRSWAGLDGRRGWKGTCRLLPHCFWGPATLPGWPA